MASDNLSLRMVISAVDDASGVIARITKGFDTLKERAKEIATGRPAIDRLNEGLNTLSKGLGAVVGAAGLAGLAKLSDEYANLQAKLKLATDGQDAYVRVSREVSAIAERTASDLDATASLYATLTRALDNLGDKSIDVAGLTETIAQAMQIGGASAQASSAALVQLSQALASGVLRGDEFNSVMEQAPRLSRALSDSLGVTTGELRAMAKEGQLSAQAVIRALQEQAGAIAAEFAVLPETFGRAMTRLQNTVVEVIGRISESAGASALFGRAITALEAVIRRAGEVLEWFAGVIGQLLVWFAELPAPLQVLIGLWAAMQVTGTDLIDVLGAILSGLVSLALTLGGAYLSWLGFTSSVRLASVALTALWGVIIAHPIGALVTALGLGVAAWWTFRLSAEETAQALGELRTATREQIDEIGRVRAAMASAQPGSDAYNAAAKRLGELIPGLNLSLDQHGMVIAEIGAQHQDNARLADEYVRSLRAIDDAALAQQLALSYQAWQDSSEAVAEHTRRLRENYGLGQESSTGFQRAQLAVGQWTGEITRANRAGLQLNEALRTDKAQFEGLAQSVLRGEVAITEITQALEATGASAATIRGVTDALQAMIATATRTGPVLTTAQQSAVLAGRQAATALQATATAVGKAIKDLDKAIKDQQQSLAAAVQAESADWRAMGEMAKGAYDAAIIEIDRYAQARSAAIESGSGAEREKAAQLLALERKTAAERLAALQAYQTQALALLEQEGQRREEVARRTGGNAAAVEVEVLTAKRAVLQQIETEYRRHIDALNTESRRHLDEVRRIEDEIRGLKQSTEDRIRELSRSGMSDAEAYYDRRRQAAEKAAAAERAIAQGQYEQAQALARQSADLYAQGARAVVDGDKEIISSKRAAKDAITGVGQAAQIETRALQGLAEQHRQQAAAATEGATQTERALQGVKDQLDQINQTLSRQIRLKLEVDESAVDALVQSVEQRLAERTFLLTTQADLTQLSAALVKAQEQIASNPVQLALATEQAQVRLEEFKARLSALATDNAAASELTLNVDKAMAALATVETRLQDLADPVETEHTVRSNVDEVQAQIAALERDTSSTHTIYVRQVSTNALGGLVPGFAAGGPVFRPPRWDVVPGFGALDSVPAALPRGSYVLRKLAAAYYGSLLDRLSVITRPLRGDLVPSLLTPGERVFGPGAVQRWGYPLFDRLNRMQVPRGHLERFIDGFTAPVIRFAAGGPVGSSASSAGTVASGRVLDTVNIRLTVGTQTVSLQGAREQVARLTGALRDLQRGL